VAAEGCVGVLCVHVWGLDVDGCWTSRRMHSCKDGTSKAVLQHMHARAGTLGVALHCGSLIVH
jgi:hypothetical protein